jgi:membrane associated rhomboid family serine protease
MRGFNFIPPVIKNLLIINVLVYLAQITFQKYPDNIPIDNLFALHDIHSAYFQPYQVITYLFMHGGWDHIFFNMLALWMFGTTLENYWGSKRFLIFYMACGIGAGLLQLAVTYPQMAAILEELRLHYTQDAISEARYAWNFPLNVSTVGASGAVFGCLAAFGYLFPNSLIYIYALFPIKAKWLVLIYAGIEIYLGVANSAGDNVAHWAHIGGALVGIILVLIWNRNNRRNFY